MTQRTIRTAALVATGGTLVSLATSILVVARIMSDRPSTMWNILDLAGDLAMIVGLVGFAATRAAAGRWGRIGLSMAFAGLGVFTLAGAASFLSADAGDVLHPVSVPLTGAGMTVTGIAVLRTRRWRGWARYTPLACGLIPFVVELPGFIVFGDSPNLHAFIAATTISWLVFFTALWATNGPAVPARADAARTPVRAALSLLLAVGVIGATVAVAVTARPGRAFATTYYGPWYGPYEFTSNDGGRCLDAAAQGNGANGTPIQLWDCYPPSQANQMWYLRLVTDTRYSGQVYQIRSYAYPNQCVDANLGNGGGGNSTPIQLWQCLTGDWWNQLWRYTCTTQAQNPEGTWYPTGCSFESLDFPGQVLDADWGYICCNGTHIQLWKDLGHANQRWAQIQWTRS